MLNIQKTIKFIAFTAVFVLAPAISFADHSYDSSGYDYSSGWESSGLGNYGSDYYSPSSSYYNTYTPYTYSSTPSYTGSSNYNYPTYSYTGSNTGNNSYNPGYTYTGGSSYPIYNYSSSSIAPSRPSTSNSTSNSTATANPKATATNNTTVTTNSSANAVASSTNINNNINNNNVYVYTNPQGTAVLQNPAFQHLDGYCLITPNNPRIGQTVTVTAYATGGIGSYSYTWGGDIYYGSGPSTQFTSQTAGTKNIAVTVRSGEEVVTRNCSVTFQSDYVSYTGSYTGSNVSVSRVSSGNPVSGVFVQPGTPVSGVYLNQLPATGIDLSWIDYMIAFFALVLGTVIVLITRSRKQLLAARS